MTSIQNYTEDSYHSINVLWMDNDFSLCFCVSSLVRANIHTASLSYHLNALFLQSFLLPFLIKLLVGIDWKDIHPAIRNVCFAT